jgi:hypothetical protein
LPGPLWASRNAALSRLHSGKAVKLGNEFVHDILIPALILKGLAEAAGDENAA